MKKLIALLLLSPLAFAEDLYDLANSDGRWIKTSTVIDCRKQRSNASIDKGFIGLKVKLIDFSRKIQIYYNSHHAFYDGWSDFKYKLDPPTSISNIKDSIRDINDEDHQVIFVGPISTKWIFDKVKMELRMFYETETSYAMKCRYL
tara:strand:- start:218 stop:655 length:438 start_codon:yes stop_codon:yes gene_type:complete